MPTVDIVTEPRLAYLHLHGRDTKAYVTGKTVAERFHYDYSDQELDEVALKAAERLRLRLGQAGGVWQYPQTKETLL